MAFPTMLASLALVGYCLATAQLHADVIYSNDFQGAVGGEWSLPQTALTPTGRSFLGVFVNEQPSLTLPTVPMGTPVLVSFDLFVINTWDGSQYDDPLIDVVHQVGPDVWQASVDGGPVLINTSFSVFDGTKAMHSFRDYPQSYPGSYPADSFPARTGAIENDTLGYFEGDSVYRLNLSFTAPGGPITLHFGGQFPAGDPEEWGIDNMVVTAVPEPASLGLALAGIVGLAAMGWWRRGP